MKAGKILPCGYFRRPALEVAPELLGKKLCIQTDKALRKCLITEVEAYVGVEDKANHASRGRTPRTDVMFQEGRRMYVYLVYGMHHMFNIVVGEKGDPSAILIRGIKDRCRYSEYRYLDGPGRLTKQLGIDMSFNGRELGVKSGIWIEEGVSVPENEIQKTPRIGVDYAGEWATKPYRFVWNKQNSKSEFQ